MSYNIQLTAMRFATVFEQNMTSNVSGIWKRSLFEVSPVNPQEDAELGAFALLGGLKPLEQAHLLEEAVRHVNSNPEIYIPFESKNGWGTIEGAVEVMRDLAAALRANPDAKLSVHR